MEEKGNTFVSVGASPFRNQENQILKSLKNGK
jgi:hypothetical protein